ncbi:MAG: rhodanese-like domain-containing protein [Clostridia bacterium]|nr:rhodanese-like domain-containing protein [Clostridia bacterium]
MKRIILLTVVLLALLCGCAPQDEEKIEKMTYTQITMDKAVEMMESESGYIILDVRTVEEFNERHIPGAICVPNESIGAEPIEELPQKDQLILVYCRSGRRSKEAAEKLSAMGYSNIYEFGGILDWTGETVSEK